VLQRGQNDRWDMNNLLISWRFVWILMILSCGSSGKKSNPDSHLQGKIAPIALIGIDELQQEDLPLMLRTISNCNPSVIAICVLINEVDSALVSSVKNSGRVLLGYTIVDNRVIESDAKLKRVSLGRGFMDYTMRGDRVAGNLVSTSFGGTIEYSMPITILQHHDKERFIDLFEQLIPLKPYKINFTRRLEDFDVVDDSELDSPSICERLKGKIVLLGRMDSSPENTVEVEFQTGERSRIPQILVVANSTLTLLESGLVELD